MPVLADDSLQNRRVRNQLGRLVNVQLVKVQFPIGPGMKLLSLPVTPKQLSHRSVVHFFHLNYPSYAPDNGKATAEQIVRIALLYKYCISSIYYN